jgi:hypothetical protein
MLTKKQGLFGSPFSYGKFIVLVANFLEQICKINALGDITYYKISDFNK